MGIFLCNFEDLGLAKYKNDFTRVSENNFPIRKGRNFYSREKLERLAGNSIVVDVLVAIFAQVAELKKLLWSGEYLPIGNKKHTYRKNKNDGLKGEMR